MLDLSTPPRVALSRPRHRATHQLHHLVRAAGFPPFRISRFYATSCHSVLMPANLTTLAHFSVSSATSLAKSATEPESGSLPRSAIRAFTTGSASAALTSRLSRSTILPTERGKRRSASVRRSQRHRVPTFRFAETRR